VRIEQLEVHSQFDCQRFSDRASKPVVAAVLAVLIDQPGCHCPQHESNYELPEGRETGFRRRLHEKHLHAKKSVPVARLAPDERLLN
jgi:hypothetical protein